MRRFFVAIALTSAFVCAFAGVGASAASAAAMPAEGVFEGCPLDTAMSTCLQRLQTMQQGGVNVVVFPADYASLSSLQTYAATAHGLGMSVMWETGQQGWWQDPTTSTSMTEYYQAFSAACGCTQNGQLLAYMIHWLAALPGTYGYYAADDSMLAPGDAPAVANYIAQIKAQDPSHTVMIGSADESQTNGYVGSADMIGAEIYPITNSSLMPASANQDTWSGVAQTASDTQSAANRAGKQSAFILQAFTWGDNLSDGQAIGVCTPSDTAASCYAKAQYPDAAAQLELRNEVIEHAHPSLILWWSFPGTFGQAGTDTYSIYPTGQTAAARWSGLSAAIQAPAPSTAPAKHHSAPRAHSATATIASTRRSTRRSTHSRRTHKTRRNRRTHGTRYGRRHERHTRRHAVPSHRQITRASQGGPKRHHPDYVAYAA